MSTFVHYLTDSSEERWQEVNLLIDQASDKEGVDKPLYNALCRAIVVLIVAHFEGFMKELARSIVQDINQFSTFNKTPTFIKRTFCRTFVDIGTLENHDKSIEDKINRLVDMFDLLDTKFTSDPFLPESAHGNNRNPSPTIISRVCSNFGVENVFLWMYNSKLDIVFNNYSSDVSQLISDLRSHTITNTQSFPYTIDISTFELKEVNSTRNIRRSLWETFIDELLRNRHDVAHGNSLENSLSVGQLAEFRDKAIVLEYALTLILCHKSAPNP